MAETLSVISLISFLAAGVFAILAVVLWFVFHIPTVAGELSGRTAKKSIERTRRNNEEASKNSRGAGPVRDKGKNSPADERQTRKNRSEGDDVETALRAESAAGTRRRETVQQGSETARRSRETAQQSRETARRSRETAQQSRETEVLADAGSLEASGSGNPQRRMSAVKIELLEEILFIHTKEVIE